MTEEAKPGADKSVAKPADKPTDAQWRCEVGGVPESGLTVGAEFQLKCAGNGTGSVLNGQSLQLELPTPDRYRLRILETKSLGIDGAEFVVTGYMTGGNNVKDAVLTDGLIRVALEPFQFEVASVLEPNAQPKMSPPESPVYLMWPLPVLLGIGAVVLSALGIFFWILGRRRRRLEFANWLTENRTPLSPYDQFSKDLRMVAKLRDPVEQLSELERAARWYIARQYKVPSLNASRRKLVQMTATGDRALKKQIAPVTTRFFGEIERLRKALSSVQAAETVPMVLAMIELTREYVDALERFQKSGKKGRRRKAGGR